MYKKFRILIIPVLCFTLSGCIVAAIGAGAGGGYYFGNHYKVVKKQ